MPSLFPDPRKAPHDIIAIGDDLTPSTLLDAYEQGIFPWPSDEIPLPWFCPKQRAVLFFDEIHISRSLGRARRTLPFRGSIDQSFEGVIRACSIAPRPGQEGTWIFPEVIDAYTRLHAMGRAHSAEVWDGDELVGGIYGVDMGGAFGGESMFYHRPNASKIAILHLVEHLASRGLDWMDIQVMTPHMEAMGARLISRNQFLDLLAETQAKKLKLF